ncbi:hypothetical protein GPECTOR_21g660 [Gonium pectorale]|uniref:Peptidase M11 gametolysin domain-containing protein n=1 Tax=Gonium pectorale TaxID=33097 RepID=A0A150GHY8_GONPE|nr:hypothetical protein GPECTOR_21g660 [Gonium pectorale]|eukprot:KXZ49434.1 hypothetical protein GPECTOR_21g660 [Gonium pectorale]
MKLFGNASVTLSQYYRFCSYNTTDVDVANSIAISVKLPCTGTGTLFSATQNWTVNSCHGNNPYGWFTFAERYAVNTLGIDLSVYNHRVIVMPKGHTSFQEADCGWAGLSTTGPVRPYPPIPNSYLYSYTWIAGDTWGAPWLWFHELGHSLWLQHANSPGMEYGDIASAMGAAKGYGLRCFNPPQVWQLGWGSPYVPPITRRNLRRGVGRGYWIPAAHTESDHFLRIPLGEGMGADWDVSGVPDSCAAQLWVSYRASSVVYDMPWKDVGTGAVFVHRWNGSSYVAAPKTMLAASLRVPNGKSPSDITDMSYEEDGCRLVVSAKDFWLGYAYVVLCVKTSDDDVETDCGNRLDDDCDGLIDMDDPDCLRPPSKVVSPGGKRLPPPPPVRIPLADDEENGLSSTPGLIFEDLLHVMLNGKPRSPPSPAPPSPSPPRPPPPANVSGPGKKAAANSAGSPSPGVGIPKGGRRALRL